MVVLSFYALVVWGTVAVIEVCGYISMKVNTQV